MTSALSEEYLDPNTPDDVVVTDVAPPRLTDPTLGVALGAPTVPAPSAPARRLVVLGDSLTHGVSSGAVFHTDMSWAAQVARAIGADEFAFPTYGGPLDGLPVNIESLLRHLEAKVGSTIGWFEVAELPFLVHDQLDGNEDYWERGPGAAAPSTAVRYDNLGIYGWDLRDALSSTARRSRQAAESDQHDDFLGVKPAADNDIAAWSVLASFGDESTQVSAAEQHGADGGIDTLMVALGSNNVLDSVVSKDVRWSAAGFDRLSDGSACPSSSSYNVWRPTHFAQEYEILVDRLRRIPARRVVLTTVPHVTIAPIANGLNPENPGQKWQPGSRYFPCYADPWIDEAHFDPRKHRHLTHQQVRAIDSAIDQYNSTITAAVRAARRDGRDWYVFDLCGLLDALAHRRFATDAAAAARSAWVPYELPRELTDLDTRRFSADRDGRHAGGLFGLDMIHPTICGYGVVADEVLAVLATAGVTSTPLDFGEIRARDRLVSDPPTLLDDAMRHIAPIATRFVSRRRQ